MKNRVKLIVSILCMILIVTLTGCNNIQETKVKEEAKGFLWEATKGDITINLVGTIHPAPDTYNLLSEKVRDSIKDSDVLWVEVDLTNKENINKFEKSYYLESGKTVKDYLSKEYITKLENILSNYNIELKQVETYNSMALASLIDNLIYKEMEFTGLPSDNLIVEIASKNNVKVEEVEGANYQIDVLNKIYTWEFLEETIDNFKNKEKDKEELNMVFQNYVNGDVESANEYEDKMIETYDDEIYEILIKDRNIKMVEKIKANMTDGKKHTLAVGYRHFMGKDSIIKLLELEGYKVKKL